MTITRATAVVEAEQQKQQQPGATSIGSGLGISDGAYNDEARQQQWHRQRGTSSGTSGSSGRGSGSSIGKEH
jgi:hypothetical protein